jgi:hypothetical protein
MKSEILKIAGVKSEKEFYKKYPSEEAFMKAHGKAFKKAQIGTLIGGASPKQSASKPASYVNFQELYDESDKLITGSTQAERDKAAYDQAVLQASANQNNSGGEGMSGVMGGVGDMLKLFGGQGGEGMDMPDLAMSRYGSDVPRAYSGYTTPNWFNNTTVNNTTNPPNSYYNKFTTPGSTAYGQNLGIGAQTMGRLGEPQTSVGTPAIDTTDPNWMRKKTNTPPYAGAPSPSSNKSQEETESGFSKVMGTLGKFAGPISNIAQGVDEYIAGQRELKNKRRDTVVSNFARMASATREEESERRYVRPEDIQNTGEEFFPIYGVGTNVLKRNGGAIYRAQNGSMIGGNPTEIQNTYSNGYDIYTDGGYEPLQDPNQVKDFRHGGYLHRAQDGFWSGGADPNLYSQIGGVGAGIGQAATGGKNAGGKIGGTIGQVAGTAIGGPIGGMIGEAVLGTLGNLADTTQRDMKKEQDKQKANMQAMALNSGFQGLQETHNRYVRNGGDIPSYEYGGYMNPEYNPQVIAMFGDHTAEDFADYANKFRAGGHLKSYTPPSNRAMETYAMGGQLQTHWGGGAETMSYNPYTAGSGEMVKFNGQSHTESDGNGQTGIGITYGENPVEVERGEPMFEMEAGGEINPETGKPETTGVVLGNLLMNKNVASQFNDPDLMKVAEIYNGKRMKNIGIELAKQEAKQNKIISKNSDLIDSLKVETSIDKARLAGLQAMLDGADTNLRNIANTKIILANFQNSINEAKDELSEVIGENLSAEDLSKGYVKLDKDPVTKDAKWGGNIAKKAKDGITTTSETTSPPKSFKSEREANAAGYYKGEDGQYRRKIKKFSTKDEETKSADALGYVPAGQKQSSSGTWGKVTPAMLEEAKKANSWYTGWKDFDPKKKTDVLNFQRAFNARAKALGSSAKIDEDGAFGEQTVTARIDESRKTQPAQTEEELTAVVEEPTSTPAPEEKPKYPWMPLVNQALRFFTPTDQSELDAQQIYPEMYAMASNQVEPVPAQSYQPELIVPYDISLQAQRNSVMSAIKNRERQLGYNPAAQANMAPAEYNALNEINEKEFIANQGLKNQVYTGNVNTMNEAKKINLGIFADQWAKQSQARSNTKATTQAALNSIADKYAKNKLENRKLSIYENMYNYRFGKSGRAQNWNGLQFFDTTIGGGKGKGESDIPEGYKATAYDANGNPISLKRITEKDMEDDEAALEAVGGIKNKNGGSTKKNYKNSSVVRAFKNL